MALTEDEQKAYDRLCEQFMTPDIQQGVDVAELDTQDGTVVQRLDEIHFTGSRGQRIPLSDMLDDGEMLAIEDIAERAEMSTTEAEMVLGEDGVETVARHDNKVLARLSASGFVDSTDMAWYESVEQAKRNLIELYGDELAPGEDTPDTDPGPSP